MRALVVVVLLGCAAALPGQRLGADVTTVQIGEEERLIGTLAEDLNADGLLDLVLVKSRRGRGSDRLLQVHLQRKGTPPFDNRPERPPWKLPANVVAFAVGDVLAPPGNELLLFSPNLVVALFWDQDEPKVAAVAEMSLLWQPRRARGIVGWQAGVRDLDGDGLVDLVLPEPDGYRIAFQARDAQGNGNFDRVVEVPLPPGLPLEDRRQQRVELRLSFGVGPEGNPWLLRINDIVPAPQLVDWDADGDLDLMVLRDDELLVWVQDGSGFGEATEFTLQVPQATLFDPAYIARATDVNGDGRADVLIGTSRTVDSEVTSTIALWVQQDGGLAETPTDRFRFRGFTGLMALEDLDGDDRPELVVGTLRTDMIDALTAGDEARLDAQLNVLRNGFAAGEGFVRPVALVHPMTLSADLDGDGMRATFFADCDGDGLRDLLVSDGRRRVRIMLTREDGAELSLPRTAWQLQLERGARVRSLPNASVPSMLILERNQIVHVRIR